MGKLKYIVFPLLAFLLVAPLIYLLSTASHFGFFGAWKEIEAISLTNFTLETEYATQDLTLPHTFLDEEPNQLLVLKTQVLNAASERLYVKTVYAPLRIYANDELIYDYGAKGTYPDFLDDPPVKVVTIELPNEAEIDLRIEYNFPTSRSDLAIDAPLVGTYPSIFNALIMEQENFSFLFIFFLGFGLLLLCIGFFIRTFEHLGVVFIRLGLINICCGLWGLGEYDITGIVIQNETLLYILGFAGVLFLPSSIHFYFKSTVSYKNPKPITFCGYACIFLAFLATLLQATATLSFYNILPYFLFFVAISFIFSIGYTVYEWRANENQLAKIFLLPWVIVIITSLIECISFMLGSDYSESSFAQLGLLVFILANSIIGGVLIRKTLALREQNRIMEQEYKMMEVQVAEQHRYHHLLMETRQTFREQRHDLHHQLAVIRSLAKENSLDKLNRHLDSINDELPEDSQIYCDNISVNSVVAHYITKAKANGITAKINLTVPEPVEQISDSSLCVIFGNILENAVEACCRMSDGGKFITLSSHIQNELLVITLKNSFEGPIHQKDDKFYSSKRGDFGIGITSVQTVARKHGGNATFTVDGRVFQSAVYVRI